MDTSDTSIHRRRRRERASRRGGEWTPQFIEEEEGRGRAVGKGGNGHLSFSDHATRGNSATTATLSGMRRERDKAFFDRAAQPSELRNQDFRPQTMVSNVSIVISSLVIPQTRKLKHPNSQFES